MSAGPTLGPQQLQQLGVRALERFGLKAEKLRRGAVYGPVDDAASGFRYSLGTAEQPLPTGRYTLFVFCRGEGRIAVTWQADTGRGTVDAPCNDLAERFPRPSTSRSGCTRRVSSRCRCPATTWPAPARGSR
ncbi:hypothetical protein ACFQY4_26880 [Catellatospora bangladeshensis]|uniref:hypothetical protein n=1 Tax=Catellatospora bangladeshensis TaxID=310355 RepID=UPI00360F325D